MARSPAAKALEAAAELDAWLARESARPPPAGAGEPRVGSGVHVSSSSGTRATGARATGGAGEGGTAQPRPFPDARARGEPGAVPETPHSLAPAPEVLAPAHTDWLHHHLTVAGPADDVARFRAAGAGAGVVPWAMDWDRLEEDWAHLLLAPASPRHRTLSAAGARMLAGELREVAQRRHEAALARVGRGRSFPFDLHALVPVPAHVLALGPDHPDALAWLWAHWGTTQPLRHVRERADVEGGTGKAMARTRRPPSGRDAMHLAFWSADWTPWRAIARVRQDWPALRLDVRPIYEPS